MKRIVVHHSASTLAVQFDSINQWHKDKWNSISELGFYGGYNYLIEKDGTLKQYRIEGEETIAQRGYNFDSLSVCLAGNFERGIETPTQAQIASLKAFLSEKMALYGLTPQDIVPHRYLSS